MALANTGHQALPMRRVSFRPRPRPYPLLGLGAVQRQPPIVQSTLAPQPGQRGGARYARALSVVSPGTYQQDVRRGYRRARAGRTVLAVPPLAISGIRAKHRQKPKKRRKSVV